MGSRSGTLFRQPYWKLYTGLILGKSGGVDGSGTGSASRRVWT